MIYTRAQPMVLKLGFELYSVPVLLNFPDVIRREAK